VRLIANMRLLIESLYFFPTLFSFTVRQLQHFSANKICTLQWSPINYFYNNITSDPAIWCLNNASGFYSEGVWFEARPGPKAKAWIISRFSHNRFLPNPFQYIIQFDATYSRYWETGKTHLKTILLATCFQASFLFGLFFRPWRWRRYVPPKRRLTLNGLHGVI
jgi:hypothetical protein